MSHIDVAYREFGQGEPLVLVTALGALMDMWDARFVLRLAARYRVVIFDNRGIGRTGAGTAPWSVGRFASDTAGLIRALGFERAHLLGWSLGGDVALCLAVDHPELLDR